MLHIDLPTRADIERLAAHRGAPAVSIYLPTTPLTQAAQADRIALKGLLKEAVARMEALDTPKREVAAVEDAIDALIEDDGVWAEQANSLAVFALGGRLATFRLPNRLSALVEVADRAHLKPLLRAVTFAQEAYVLAIGIGACRLVEVSADLPPHVAPVPNLPRDFNAALGVRSHLPQGTMGRSEAMSEHALLTRYARAIDQALRPVLSGHERPLIVAASEPLASIFRAVSSYPHTAEETIPGSADHTPDHALAEAARGVLDRIHAGRIEALAALYAVRENQGRATADLVMAARAATFGAIDTLIFDIDAAVWGAIGEEDGALRFADGPGPGVYGVTDEIVRRAMGSGATLVAARAADIPGGGALAAILREPDASPAGRLARRARSC